MQSRKPLAVCAVFNFLKSNMHNTLHLFLGIPCVYRHSERKDEG